MTSFQTKLGWKMLRKRENKNYRFISFLPNAQQKIPKKFKNTITDSFQAKIGWRRIRKRENNNYRSVSFLPMLYRKFLKNNKKIEKIPLRIHFKPKQEGK